MDDYFFNEIKSHPPRRGMEEPRGRRIRESAGDAIVDAIRRAAYMETPTGTPSGTRAAGDVGPYHGTTW